MIGTKGSANIIKVIRSRDQRLKANVEKYNKLAKELCSQGYQISPLPAETVGNILADDSFWELERMHSREPWAINQNIRTGIDMYLQLTRAREAIEFHKERFDRYLNYHSSRIIHIRSEIAKFPEGSLLHMQLKLEVEKSNTSIIGLRKHFHTLWEPQRQKPKTWQHQEEWIVAYKDVKEFLERMFPC
jgi:hypothetical protein